jgi:hypothetical protein
MDFVNHEFHAQIETYINVGPVLKGVGPNGRAGWGVVHVSDKEWYVNIGTPDDPIGISFLGLARVGGYFMAGYDIPADLPVNPKVAAILGMNANNGCSGRDNSQIQTGKGIAFGATYAISTGDLTFMIFYASFDVGVGFDVMMINYGEQSYCQGHNAPVGINGWYAKGQAYAYFEGKIGVEARVFRRTRKFDIFDIAAAVLLEADGPNPIYLEGVAGGHYSVLGGLVKGECKFTVTVGEKCKLVQVTPKIDPKAAAAAAAAATAALVADLNMIGDITPKTNETDVDVFVNPQAVFNVPIGQDFTITDDDNIAHSFRMKLENVTLKNGGTQVKGGLKWNDKGTVLLYQTFDMLFPETDYTFEVEVSYETWENKAWVAVINNGVKESEVKSITFTTGIITKEIPTSDIANSYPIQRQYNFYTQEVPQGHVQFDKNVAQYFSPGKKWTQIVRFVPVLGGSIATTTPVYNPSTNTVSFNIPADLPVNKIYRLEMVDVPVEVAMDANVTENTTNTGLDDSNNMQVTTREATGTVSNLQEFVFLKYAFRASKYTKFVQKLNASEMNVTALYDISPYVYYLQATLYGDEMFDKFEIYGDGVNPPLVRRTALLDNSPWYKENVEPVVYKNYPLFGNATIDWRYTPEVGVPPTGEIKIWQLNYDHVLTDNEAATGIATANASFAQFMYTLPYYWAKDYYDIRMKLANMLPSMTNPDPQVNNILKNFFWPVVSKGVYPVKFEYVLPGSNVATSSTTININDPFEIVQPKL